MKIFSNNLINTVIVSEIDYFFFEKRDQFHCNSHALGIILLKLNKNLTNFMMKFIGISVLYSYLQNIDLWCPN